MPVTERRRPYRQRGTVLSKVNMSVKLDAPLKAKLDKVADAVGISQGGALELVLENLEIDANGRPSWYDGPLATEGQRTTDELAEAAPLQDAS